jgi:hypothetical protein
MCIVRIFADAWPLQVLPILMEHKDEMLLRELYQRWQNHKIMVRWLSRFFNYLDRLADVHCISFCISFCASSP